MTLNIWCFKIMDIFLIRQANGGVYGSFSSVLVNVNYKGVIFSVSVCAIVITIVNVNVNTPVLYR